MLAQVLAGVGVNGINLSNLGSLFGKRDAEERGEVLDALMQHAAGLYATQIKPTVENSLNGTSNVT